MSSQPADLSEHLHRLRALYGSTAPTPPEAEHLRQQLQHVAEALPTQLIEAAACAGPAAGSLSTPAQCEQYITRLRGLARLALQLRDALAKGGEG